MCNLMSTYTDLATSATFKHPIQLQYTQLDNDHNRGFAKLQAFSYGISGLSAVWMKSINEVKNIDLLGEIP